MGGNIVVNRSIASSLRLRAGMGLSVGKHIVPNRPLPVNDELVWDNGTLFPEPFINSSFALGFCILGIKSSILGQGDIYFGNKGGGSVANSERDRCWSDCKRNPLWNCFDGYGSP